jgi:hypothetical protein
VGDIHYPQSWETKISITFREFQRRLRKLSPRNVDEISLADRLDMLIPSEDRRRVWQDLKDSGFDLPALRVSAHTFVVAAFLVFIPALLTLMFQGWSLALCWAKIGMFTRKLTRPFAIHPPPGCTTIREAVLHLSQFRMEDYRAGLWTPEDIASKVRHIIALASGVPLKALTDKTKIFELDP